MDWQQLGKHNRFDGVLLEVTRPDIADGFLLVSSRQFRFSGLGRGHLRGSRLSAPEWPTNELLEEMLGRLRGLVRDQEECFQPRPEALELRLNLS